MDPYTPWDQTVSCTIFQCLNSRSRWIEVRGRWCLFLWASLPLCFCEVLSWGLAHACLRFSRLAWPPSGTKIVLELWLFASWLWARWSERSITRGRWKLCLLSVAIFLLQHRFPLDFSIYGQSPWERALPCWIRQNSSSILQCDYFENPSHSSMHPL